VQRENTPKNTWDRVLEAVGRRISSRSFATWFGPTRFLGEDAASLRVQVPNNWFAEWLRTHYIVLIQQALRDADRSGLAVEFRAECAETACPVDPPAGGETGLEATHPFVNPRYTFSSFVVSSCNQFAHAAAMAVAEQPMRAYNPLYIYGGVGLGKTHLMQAIGNRVARKGLLRMSYVSSEHFVNELINAIRFKRTMEFKERFRKVDLLLIDDIQFLAGKERTQEEFFHTFNALYDSSKQIVITSDVPPREIPTLEDRLRSRFEWGLIADLQPPDLETKIAILRKKAEAEGTDLPDDVALFVASSCKSNIRELEGALIRLIAYASMSGKPIDLDLARETLRDVIIPDSPAATTESIVKTVANFYNLKVSQLKARTNSHKVARPRQVAMYLCKQLTDSSLQEIGRKFGGKHHSTVIHAIQRVEARRASETDFNELVDRFIQSLK
jgi:chromosomal replication initiator protein